MTELLTAAQMRAIEAAAIASGKVTGLELMERAGAGVVEAIYEQWPELAKGAHKAVVLCGPGNNGGDGFVVARLLKECGWAVEVYLYGDAGKLPPDARLNYQLWEEIGEVRPLASIDPQNDHGCDLLVDALFGTGLIRALDRKDLLQVLAQASGPEGRVRHVAIDMPSGLCSDSGRVLGGGERALNADLTVSFHAPKLGHYLNGGPWVCGRMVVADIGLKHIAGRCRLAAPDVAALSKGAVCHKFTHGHALILSGPSGKGGAARLAARGALRIGAGLVTLGCPPDAVAENAARMDAVMLSAIHDGDALARVLQDVRINVLCLGPGLGLERARELLPVALQAGRASVLDADALSAYAKNPAELFDILHESCILTPHAGEFARLFPDIAEKLGAAAMKGPAYSKLDATREAAARAGCVVLFKGVDTVIAAPDGRAALNSAAYERTAPWLATAGSGDVLAGFITGLLARGFAPVQAAESAAWLHVKCARSFGPGLVSEDLPDELPRVFRDLGLQAARVSTPSA